MFSSYFNLYPASHKTPIDIRDVCDSPGTVCASFAVSGMPSMSRLHVCVDLSLDPYVILIVICLLAGCIFFTGVTGRENFSVSPESAMASLLFILMIDVEYAVSVFLFVRLLIIFVFSSSSSPSAVASRLNLLLVFCLIGYNKFTVFGSILLFFLPDLDLVDPNRHPLHCCCCY